MGADGGEEDGWDVGMDHGSPGCYRVGCAACGGRQHHSVSLYLHSKTMTPSEVTNDHAKNGWHRKS